MECFSGVGAAAAAGAFSYNRSNFQGDREQRRRASVKLMTWRVEQAKLWRQDVRDLISLTEYKMHMYLIVNVLVLGFTIFLFTEGRLPAGTPHWLMLGNVISIGAAFMFLLLSIWLAMHAAISAQSFEARLLTQMVRLPIPTWEEMEATRTYGSEFEKLEGRQMFRVPWLCGWQEGLVGSRPPPASATAAPEADVEAGRIGNPNIGEPPLGRIGNPNIGDPPEPPTASATADPGGNLRAPAVPTQGSSAAGTEWSGEWNVDPWGLEQAGEGLPELGCGLGADVAKLRHVKLSRQAAIQWQTYDAFSRISMSMGVQQLLMAMNYYMLGYLLVQVECKTAAVFGVILFTMMANTIVKLDMTLAPMQLRLVQFLLVFGPVCACASALLWADFENHAAEFVVPIAFISHGLYFALVAAFCRIRIAENGAWLPVAFRSVLYLDVFSWTRGQAFRPTVQRNVLSTPDAGPRVGRPALQAVKYVDGLPVPLRPEDLAPEGIKRDLREVPGAPNILRPPSAMEGRDEEFYNPASFLPVEEADEEDQNSPKRGWIEKMGPGELPWRVFCTGMFLVSALWLLAAAYCVHGAKTNWSLDLSIREIRHHKPDHRPGFVGPDPFEGDSVGLPPPPWWENLDESQLKKLKGVKWDRWSLVDQHGPQALEKSASFLAGEATRSGVVPVAPEQIMVSWPWPNIAPSHLTCDVSGSHFVMADRVLMFSATMHSNAVETGADSEHAHKSHIVFGEFDCPAVLGEGLEDVAISCNSSTTSTRKACEVLALHRHGRRLAACQLGMAKAGSQLELLARDKASIKNVEEISDKWLENSQTNDIDGGRARSQVEKALSISINPECKGEVGEEFCAVLGTTHGRVVQLGRHSSRKELIPTEILYEGHAKNQAALSSGVVRAFNQRYLGVLQPKHSSIRILDLSKGGAAIGDMPLPLSKPVSSFCTGGGNVYMLTHGPDAEMWRIPVPEQLMPDGALAFAP